MIDARTSWGAYKEAFEAGDADSAAVCYASDSSVSVWSHTSKECTVHSGSDAVASFHKSLLAHLGGGAGVSHTIMLAQIHLF